MSQHIDLHSPSHRPRAAGKQRRFANLMILAGAALVVFAVGGLLLTTFPAKGDNNSVGPARVGSPLRDFSLINLDGKTVKLSDYSGRLVLINFWATWCPPCRAEMPYLHAFYQQYRAQGFIVLAVNVGESAEVARSFVERNGLTFPILLDPEERLANSLSIQDYPTSILVGRDGKVKTVHIGLFTEEQLEYEIAPYLSPNN